MNRFTLAVVLLSSLLATACKIEISVPTGGRVETESGTYVCNTGEVCTVDVSDIFFDEIFNGIPDAGYRFVSWRQKDFALCGNLPAPCPLFTTTFEGTKLTRFLESDDVFYLEPVFARPNTWLTRQDVILAGITTATCTVNGKLYVFGLGWGAAGFSGPVNGVGEFNPATNSWRKRADMPTPRAWATASAVKGKCYVIGGAERPFEPEAVAVVEEYDPAKNSWRTMAPLPVARSAAGSAAVGNKIYVVGGGTAISWAAQPIPEVAVFHPGKNQWSTRAEMPTPRVGVAVAAAGGRVYAAGGSNIPGMQLHSSDIMESYDPATDQWQSHPKMIEKVNFATLSSAGDSLYVLGGLVDSGNNTTAAAQRYTPANNQWTEVVEMSISRYGTGSEGIGGQIFVVGGREMRESPALSLTEEYTP